MPRKLEVEIVGDSGSLERAFGRSSSAGSRFGKTIGNVAKAGAFAAGAAGVGALFVTLRSGISEFTESSKVAAQTEAVIRSTGGAAGVTAKHVDDLAESIMRKSGIDDEAIKSGQNLLLSFTHIRNEAGKGNAIFDRATRAIADFSARTGTDLPAAAKLFGKALEDPATKLSGLARAGIVFTKQQQKMVKEMVAAGDTMGAQKFVLEELEKRYGGAAEAAGNTLPGKLNILKESFNNLAGELVSKAVPALTSFVGFLNEKGLPAIETVFGKMGEIVGPAIQGFADAFAKAGPAIIGVLEPLGDMLRTNVVPVLEELGRIGSESIKRISEIVKANGPQLRQIFENLGQVISNIAKVVVPLLEFAFTKVLPAAIAVLIPVLRVVTEVLAAVSKVVGVVAGAINAVLIPAMSALLSIGGKVAKFLSDVLVSAFESIDGPVKAVAGVLKSILVPAFNAVTSAMDAVRDLFGWFAEKASPIWQKLARIIPPAVAAITAPFQHLGDVLTAIIGLFKAFIDKAGEVIDLASKVAGAVGGVIGKIPGLQHGGVARQGQAYVVGESGPELFVPGLTGTVIPNFMEPRQVGLPGGGGVGGGGSTFILNFNGPAVGTSRDFQDLVRRAFYDVQRLNPGTGIA